MARIYYNRYMERVNAGELTIVEAIELAGVEVPDRFGWRAAVITLLEAEA